MRKIILLCILSFINTYLYSQSISVELHSIIGYGQHEGFARRAAALLDTILNSDEFRVRMMAMEFKKNNGLTNQQLYDRIIIAHELQGEGGRDSVVDLRVRTLRITGDESGWADNCEIGSRSGTIGIDGNGDGVTAICPQRLEMWAATNNVAELAGHYAHEYMHILGFDHIRFLSTQTWREKTFVYKIGDLVSDMITERIRNGQ